MLLHEGKLDRVILPAGGPGSRCGFLVIVNDDCVRILIIIFQF
jgi:hypothetical protein